MHPCVGYVGVTLNDWTLVLNPTFSPSSSPPFSPILTGASWLYEVWIVEPCCEMPAEHQSGACMRTLYEHASPAPIISSKLYFQNDPNSVVPEVNAGI